MRLRGLRCVTCARKYSFPSPTAAHALQHHFDHANNVAAAHSQATWQYPLHLASCLHEKMDEEPGRSTMDIIIHKFKHLRRSKDSDEFIPTDDPDVISFIPILQSSTHYHGLGTNRYSFKVEYHSRFPSPLGTPTIPLVSPIPHSPSYHVATPSPSPPLLSRIRSPSPPTIVSGANQELINHLQQYAHPGPPFVKNRSDGRFCITTPIKDANGNSRKAKYVRFLLDNVRAAESAGEFASQKSIRRLQRGVLRSVRDQI